MESSEELVAALDEFEQKSTTNDKVPEILQSYLVHIAKTGKTIYTWDKLKPLFLHKLNHAMLEFHEKFPTDHLTPSPNVENLKFDEMRSRILDMVAMFTGAPFTIQRLCELITNPLHHYRRTDKFLRGIEKNVLIVSSVDPSGNKIVNESKFTCNGLDTNGVESSELRTPEAAELRTPEKVTSPFMPPPPTNSPAVSLFEGTSVAADSPSPLLRSWPPSGSSGGETSTVTSEALPATSEAVPATSEAVPATSDQSHWEATFEDYLPPEKKPRLTSTPPAAEPGKSNRVSDCSESTVTASVSDSLSAVTPSEIVPGVSDMFGQQADAAIPSGADTSREAETAAVSSSESAPDTLHLSPGSQFLQTTPDAAADSSQSSTGYEAMDTSEAGPDTTPQAGEDGTDTRDSQGFDVSPNPEDAHSPSSDPEPCTEGGNLAEVESVASDSSSQDTGAEASSNSEPAAREEPDTTPSPSATETPAPDTSADSATPGTEVSSSSESVPAASSSQSCESSEPDQSSTSAAEVASSTPSPPSQPEDTPPCPEPSLPAPDTPANDPPPPAEPCDSASDADKSSEDKSADLSGPPKEQAAGDGAATEPSSEDSH